MGAEPALRPALRVLAAAADALTAHLFAVSAALRIALIAYAAWHDQHLPVRFTDVDLDVFTDAAAAVAHGGSPFDRATYRYPPVLAWALVPGVWLGCEAAVWGKALFCACDLLVGWLLLRCLRARGVGEASARRCAAVHLLSPFTLVTSARGSSDAVACALVLAALLALLRGRAALSGAALGAAVHVRIYPVIYALPLALALERPLASADTLKAWPLRWLRRHVHARSLAFACALAEGYLYHVGRVDVRHNFSPHWLATYLRHSLGGAGLGAGGAAVPAGALRRLGSAAWALAASPSLVQLGAVAAIGLACYADLPACLLLQTLAFVALNRVVTAQYFAWWQLLVPLVMPQSRMGWAGGAALAGCWLAAELHWLRWGYELEMRGQAVHAQLWGASLVFLATNTALGVALACTHRWQRTFDAATGRLSALADGQRAEGKRKAL